MKTRIAVLIPVGPGHDKYFPDWYNSLGEALVGQAEHFFVSCLTQNDHDGKLGRSRARNLLLARTEARHADWLFWLDADDLMAPDAFLGFRAALERWPTMDAVWGKIVCQRGQEPPRERPGQEYPRDYEELIRMEPTLTLQSGFFVKRSVMDRERWNETMDAGEDFDLYLRLWKGYECHKVRDCFMVNRRGLHSTGPRSANGRDWRNAVTAMLQRAQRESTRAG